MDYAPVETIYNGYRFRSRTEARWAVFFDYLGLPYEYERDCFLVGDTWYVPDFYLPLVNGTGIGPYWVEVKGATPTDEEKRKLKDLCFAFGCAGFILIGQPNTIGRLLYVNPHVRDAAVMQWHTQDVLLGFLDATEETFSAARQARFEGERLVHHVAPTQRMISMDDIIELKNSASSLAGLRRKVRVLTLIAWTFGLLCAGLLIYIVSR